MNLVMFRKEKWIQNGEQSRDRVASAHVAHADDNTKSCHEHWLFAAQESVAPAVVRSHVWESARVLSRSHSGPMHGCSAGGSRSGGPGAKSPRAGRRRGRMGAIR